MIWKHRNLGAIFVCLFFCTSLSDLLAQEPIKLEFIYIDNDEIAIANELYDIEEDKYGRLWLANLFGGGIIYDGYDFEYLNYSPGDSASLFSQELYCFLRDESDQMWLGFRDAVAKYSADGEFIQNYSLENTTTSVKNYINCFLDNKELIWVGSNEGIGLLDKNTGDYHLYQDSLLLERNAFTRGNRIFRILEDGTDKNSLWIASGWGLKRFNKLTQKYQHFPHPPLWHSKYAPGIQLAMVDMLHSSAGKYYLAAGFSGGIMSFDPENKAWEVYLYETLDYENVEKHLKVMWIEELTDSIFIYGSYMDLGYINFSKKQLSPFKNFDSERVGRMRSSLIDRNGVLWMAGEKALVRTRHPVLKKDNKPNPLLLSMKVDGEEISIDRTNKTIIPKDQKEIEFSIARINPIYEDSMLYRWRLDGFDQDWSPPSQQRHVNYTNIKGGIYNFEFQSKDRENDWMDGESFKIEIQKPLFQQLWFIITSIIAFLLLFLSIGHFFSRRSAKKNEEKMQYERRILEAELQALRSQMNPHFIFNSLNSIYNFIHANENENAAEYLAKFSKLMRLVLQNSKEKLVTLSEEVKMLEIYLELEQIRFDKKFDYTIQIEESIQRDQVVIPPMIIQPYLENAIWHGIMHMKGKGSLLLDIKKSDHKQLNIIIEDNGVGRCQSKKINNNQEKKSYGMEITRQRLDSFEILYNRKSKIIVNDLKDLDGSPCGTKIMIEVPEITKSRHS